VRSAPERSERRVRTAAGNVGTMVCRGPAPSIPPPPAPYHRYRPGPPRRPPRGPATLPCATPSA